MRAALTALARLHLLTQPVPGLKFGRPLLLNYDSHSVAEHCRAATRAQVRANPRSSLIRANDIPERNQINANPGFFVFPPSSAIKSTSMYFQDKLSVSLQVKSGKLRGNASRYTGDMI